MKLVKRLITLILLLFGLLILFENYEILNKTFSFKLNLYFIGWYTSPLPAWLVILIALAIGYASAFTFGFIRRLSYKGKIKKLEQELKRANMPEKSPINTPDQNQNSPK